MLFMGVVGIAFGVSDFTHDVVRVKSNCMILKSEAPYSFWARTIFNFTMYFVFTGLAGLFAKAGYNTMKSNSQTPNK